MTRRTPAKAESRLEATRGTVEERTARGKAARKEVPRTSHGGFAAAPGRRDPIAVLEEQGTSRVPELLPIRYGRMSSSAFAFFRGSAAVMAMDLATTPTSGIQVQVCGDAHLVNFGVYNAPDRRLVFDLNDFDETLPGPWEWDLKRLVASLVVAGRDNGFTETETADVVRDASRSYRTAMATFAAMTNLKVWYARLEVADLLESLRARQSTAQRKVLRRNSEKFAMRDNMQAFSKLTEVVDGRPRFRSEPPLIVPIDELLPDFGSEWVDREASRIFDDYRGTLDDDRRQLARGYTYEDLARKVVGVGSVGTRAWVTLLLGRDGADPLLLQFKEAQPSVLEAHLGPSEFDRAGHRVVAGQRLMQASSDIFLGWYRGKGIDGVDRDFYVRQLKDGKGSVDIATMVADSMRIYGQMCAWTMARAHARSGDRVAIASYLGTGRTFDDALVDFAHAYADQNERDHQELVAAIESGRIEATPGI
jgi:uncharacterized protein (DUF2252 family)